MSSHYDTLGVPKNATPDQIRKAWQKESAKNHPDRKGGDNERQMAVNVAYQVLSDKERRSRYDRTGNDSVPESKERELENIFMQFVTEVIDVLLKEPFANPVALMHKKVDHTEESLLKSIDEFKARDLLLEKQIKRVKRRKKDEKINLFVQVMESQRAACKEKLSQLPALVEKVRAVRPMVKEYECIPDQQEFGQQGGTTIFTRMFGS